MKKNSNDNFCKETQLCDVQIQVIIKLDIFTYISFLINLNIKPIFVKYI